MKSKRPSLGAAGETPLIRKLNCMDNMRYTRMVCYVE